MADYQLLFMDTQRGGLACLEHNFTSPSDTMAMDYAERVVRAIPLPHNDIVLFHNDSGRQVATFSVTRKVTVTPNPQAGAVRT